MNELDELKKEVEFLRKRVANIESLLSLVPNFRNNLTGGESIDPLYEHAEALAVEYDAISTALLQRKLSIGYSRASRIMDLLEEKGIIGKAEGAKPRKVLKK